MSKLNQFLLDFQHSFSAVDRFHTKFAAESQRERRDTQRKLQIRTTTSADAHAARQSTAGFHHLVLISRAIRAMFYASRDIEIRMMPLGVHSLKS
jgi:hypothetical protein